MVQCIYVAEVRSLSVVLDTDPSRQPATDLARYNQKDWSPDTTLVVYLVAGVEKLVRVDKHLCAVFEDFPLTQRRDAFEEAVL